jgi:hypothetical protein
MTKAEKMLLTMAIEAKIIKEDADNIFVFSKDSLGKAVLIGSVSSKEFYAGNENSTRHLIEMVKATVDCLTIINELKSLGDGTMDDFSIGGK